jgi:glutathione synthase/RimK-type ligase-like ATP-grasp enzyme
MPIYKHDGSVVINTTQRTQKFLDIKPYENFTTYVQFGKAKKNKKRPRVVVNPLNGLRNTRNKYQQHILLSEAGIKKPKFMRTAREALTFLNETGNPVVAKRHNHSRGRGMYRIRNEEELYACNPIILDDRQYYFEEFVTCNREWRIHVSRFQDEEVVAYRKCLLGEVVEALKATGEPKPWIRNLENCYFKLDSEQDKEAWFPDMVAECKRALDVLGMDIAGFDVGENNKVDGGNFYIYEANSACGMEDNTREQYEEAINTIVSEKAKLKGYK